MKNNKICSIAIVMTLSIIITVASLFFCNCFLSTEGKGVVDQFHSIVLIYCALIAFLFADIMALENVAGIKHTRHVIAFSIGGLFATTIVPFQFIFPHILATSIQENTHLDMDVFYTVQKTFLFYFVIPIVVIVILPFLSRILFKHVIKD